MSNHGNVILRFSDVTFGHHEKKPLLKEASFSVRENAKITLMGQNGAGKSTLFKLITKDLTPEKGEVHLKQEAKVGIAKQVMDKKYFDLTVLEYFGTAFREDEIPRNLPVLIDEALDAVNYKVSHDLKVKDLSGGQQARLLLAYAIIQKPDILLLDEPTNNLDEDGIGFLITFLMMYEKTVIVISHDANFLNTFTDGVIYLDSYTQKVDQYVGDYFDVVEEIQKRIEVDQRKNAQLLKNIQDRKDKVNFFSHKGGKMRKLAAKMKEEIAEDEANMVDVKREDKTISDFVIPAQEYKTPMVTLESVGIWKDGGQTQCRAEFQLRRGQRLLVKGPNGIGKTTLLERLAKRTEAGANIPEDVSIGYYRQDFSGLDFSQTAFDSLEEIMEVGDKETVFSTAAKFLLRGDVLKNPIEALSEGQKALLSFARFVLQQPGLLILDEPTNHVNFRHLPVIAKALSEYEGAMIVVSHDEEFLQNIEFNYTLDLGELRDKQ